jgi:16S rRNA U1498 N3-methylase RsmE
MDRRRQPERRSDVKVEERAFESQFARVGKCIARHSSQQSRRRTPPQVSSLLIVDLLAREFRESRAACETAGLGPTTLSARSLEIKQKTQLTITV